MITGIIMASGFSKRMKRNKLVLELDGSPVIERVIKAIKESKVDNIIMVYREKSVKEIGIRNGIKTIYNDRAELGQSQSMKLGVEHSPPETTAFMFFVGDQPFLNAATINSLIEVFNEGKYPIVVPKYNGEKGNPVIFSSELKGELLNIEGDKGGRSIIKERTNDVKIVDFTNGTIGKDIDTWEEYTIESSK
ncbi:molybdenum cofactor cytidylyltransferase [Wukongibacter baidiensis]|uniref:molybdenum cofactor cytidylyltransferase n=1 Tax=Wukongibacter baidiensis TaxID=1723361 RepID=UPI003D7F467E